MQIASEYWENLSYYSEIAKHRTIRPLTLMFLFIGVFLSTKSYTQWVEQQVPTTMDLLDVHFADTRNGWIVGMNGTILHSTDGGLVWELQTYSDTTVSLRGVYAMNPFICWAVGWDTLLIKTTDGGVTWNKISFGLQFQSAWKPNSILFTDSLTGWVGGHNAIPPDSDFILKTTDGGGSWQKIYYGGDTVYGSYFSYGCTGYRLSGVDNKHVWATCNRCYILRTTDGINWHSPWDPKCGNYDITDIDFVNSNLGLGGGDGPAGSGAVSISTDGGLTWNGGSLVFGCILPNVTIVSYPDSNNGWSVVANFCTTNSIEIWHTNDMGVTWDRQFIHQSNNGGLQRSVFFIDSLHGWVVGDNGLILGTINSGVTATEYKNEIIPSQFALDYNYPNPFNSSTTIGFSIPKASHVSLEIYDLLGRRVASILDELKPPGIYKVSFDYERISISSGIYFYKLTTQYGTRVRSMSYLR